MPTHLRRFLAACTALVLLVGVAAPAYSASSQETMRSMRGSDPVSPTVDVLVLRPIGFLTLIGGTALFCAALPFIAITRPHEIGKPFDRLVGDPARYIWMDPLGTH